ncbi:MAG: hypothetical protein ACI9ON_000530 [Limisphaerales bacterium]|jgi:hypothetical protein
MVMRLVFWLFIPLLMSCGADESTDPGSNQAPEVNSDWIDGQVLSDSGKPEAGVWVIAETSALPTPFRKIVVTDEHGNFVLPQLPNVGYQIWARGYGLKDTQRLTANPGQSIKLSVNTATPQEAAAIYPANYWLSMLSPPEGDPNWVNNFKLGCQLCHQVGSLLTRTKNREQLDLGLHKAAFMNLVADSLGREKLLTSMTEWQQRILDGETPPMPPRPKGVERNMVLTHWGWGDTFTYAHDEIATDKRNPSSYANQPIYGVDLANDRMLILDPITHEASTTAVPTLNGFDTPWCNQTYQPMGATQANPAGFGSLGCPVKAGITGFEGQYPNPANPHNPMMDDKGRVWITTQVRREWAEDLPEFCAASPVIANNYHHRQLGWYDPKTDNFQLIDTCFGTHHLQFDKNGVLWLSGDSYVIGWFDPAKYDPQDPSTLADAQGWSEVKVDSDGDKVADTALVSFNYGIIPNPSDGSVWLAQPGGNPGDPIDFRGRLIRYDPLSNSHEVYRAPPPAAGPRGVDVDSSGIIWVAFGGSGHLGRFDRKQCTQTWGLGDQCPEGWTLFRSPGPLIKTDNNPANERGADFHYYLFVDQFNTLGMGEDTVVVNGTGSDSLLVFEQTSEAFTTVRIPYPLNTYTRGLDGRIDDADLGWKGRGLWFTNGLDPMIHSEITQSYVGKLQLRPDPLAR